MVPAIDDAYGTNPVPDPSVKREPRLAPGRQRDLFAFRKWPGGGLRELEPVVIQADTRYDSSPVPSGIDEETGEMFMVHAYQ
jgi:hypothetical protein